MVRRHRIVVPIEGTGRRLDDFLSEWLPAAVGVDVSRSAVRRLVMAGAITIGGRIVRRPTHALRAGDTVGARVDVGRLAPGADRGVALTAKDVLYRDRWLLAVNKPAGLPAHATADARRDDLVSQVRRLILRDPDAYVAVHQRLDVDTSGVVLLAIDPEANEGLARAFAGREVGKRYLALTSPPSKRMRERWVARGALALEGSGRRARMVVVSSGGQAAETAFAIRERFTHALAIEAQPRTGRKHQIRAHLAHDGVPILGDRRYGGAAQVMRHPVPRAMLHAAQLELPHPVEGWPLRIEAPLPHDWLQLLAHLRPGRQATRVQS